MLSEKPRIQSSTYEEKIRMLKKKYDQILVAAASGWEEHQ